MFICRYYRIKYNLKGEYKNQDIWLVEKVGFCQATFTRAVLHQHVQQVIQVLCIIYVRKKI